MVGGGGGVLAVDIAGFVCEEDGLSGEGVDEGEGGAVVVAEEELGRGIRGWGLLFYFTVSFWLLSFIGGIQGKDCFLRTERSCGSCGISACILFYI
jgi:hypothetical protein